jgi:hypothetical protein
VRIDNSDGGDVINIADCIRRRRRVNHSGGHLQGAIQAFCTTSPPYYAAANTAQLRYYVRALKRLTP